MAKRRRRSKSPRRRKSPRAVASKRRRRSSEKQGGFLASSSAKAIGHGRLGAGLAAALDASPSVQSRLGGSLPGGTSTYTAIALVGVSLLTKKASTKKMLHGMALGAAGFAVIDTMKGGPDWSVRSLMPPTVSERVIAPFTALPRAQPSRASADYLASTYVDSVPA